MPEMRIINNGGGLTSLSKTTGFNIGILKGVDHEDF